MKQEKLIKILGYVILLGICCFGLFASSTILLSGYILLLFVVSSIRIQLWKKIPKEEQHVYFSWRTAILLHPMAQRGIIIFLILVDIFAVLHSM